MKPKQPRRLSAALAGVAQRALDVRLAPRVLDLDQLALFEVIGPWPTLGWRSDAAGCDAVLLGARLLPLASEVGCARSGRALMEAVAVGPVRACTLLADTASAVGSGLHAGSAVAPRLATAPASAISLSDAVKISMTDMIYVPPAEVAGVRWLGGAVDLMPVELALQLAYDVWIDLKDAVPRWTMEPAWRAVLGFDARRRQHQIDNTPVAFRFDNRLLERALPRSALQRELVFRKARWQLNLRACANEADYRSLIHAQFEEGRRRMRSALANSQLGSLRQIATASSTA